MNGGRVALVATAFSVLAGAGMAVQTSLNSHVSAIVGSPILSTAVNQSAGLALAIVVAVVSGALPRAWRRLRSGEVELRAWWFFCGVIGVAAVFAGILVTPITGLVTVTVALTLGQLGGSLMADMAGLGPSGRKPPTAWRLAGLVCAIVAVLIGAWGRVDGARPWLLAGVVVAGVVIALQQAGNGRLVVATGEFAAMSVINFAGGTILVLIVLAVVNVFAPQDFAALPPWAGAGGLVGAVVGTVAAVSARFIGMLGVMLAITAGQASAALLLDVAFPVGRPHLGPAAVVSAAMAIVAVGIAGMSRRPRGSTGPAAQQVE